VFHLSFKNKFNYIQMKVVIISFLLVGVIGVGTGNAQILNQFESVVKNNTTALSEQDAVSGIKEALSNGTTKSVSLTSITNGFFGNVEIKIPFPQDAKEVETKLRAMGMGNKIDEFVLSINRAAEDASKEATTIFIDAVKAMTVTDAINIVKGNNDAATRYLDKTTTPQLTTKFQPIIKTSLDKVDATKYWEEIITTYNKIPFVKKMNPNLTEYVTAKAISGLFVMIAKEEANIRKNPLAQTSDLLKKVFGSN